MSCEGISKEVFILRLYSALTRKILAQQSR